MDEQDGRDIDIDGSKSSVSSEETEAKQIKKILEGMENNIKQVQEQIEPVVGRISKLLQQYRGRRVGSTDSFSLWVLHFLEVELSGLSELLRELPLSDLGPGYLDSNVSCWLSRLSDLAMHIGSELDNHEQAGTAARCFCPSPSTSTTRIPFSDLFILKKYLRKVPCITESPCRYKHLQLADDGNRTSSTTSAMPHLEMDASNMPFVGIESALGNKVLMWFMDSKEHTTLKTIFMVGPVGVGKTAIAMEVCRRLQNKGREEGNILCCATAKVSRRPDMKNLLLHILSQIDEQAALEQASIDERAALEQAPIDEREALQQASGDEREALEQALIDELERIVRKISQCLQDRRYVIVIDDIWEISYWNFMKNAFPQNSRGGWIVITTRIRSIASECCSYSTGSVHEVKPLGELDSKMLLFRKAFGSEVNYPPEKFSQVCGEILRRCEGIPLFINGMAEWLKEQQQQEMEQICSYSMEEVPQLLPAFEQAMSLTYDDLSDRMKVLVLCMNMLPDGYMFDMDTLQRRWEWEDLIVSEENNGPYIDAINMLFSELTDRMVINPVASCKGKLPLQEDCQYKVNYFMLQFLASKSADKGFICTSGWLTSVARSKHNEKLRRISLHRPDPDIEKFLNERDLCHTRSLAISCTVDRVPLEKFIHLVVLNLEGWQCLKDEDLLLICNSSMFSLQHFSLRNTSVSRLPPEIKKLLMLHTLDASHTQISELLPEVCELQHLQFLDLRSTQIRQLPQHIWKVEFLNTLLVGDDGFNCDPTTVEVPEEVNLPTLLSTLGTVDLSEFSAGLLQALCSLKYIRVLSIRWSFHQRNDATLQEALRRCIVTCKLESLTIHCGLGCLMEFLASLPNPLPHGSFKKFKVTGGRFVSLPRWFHGQQSLAYIEITVCNLEQGDIWILASLPSLKCLALGLHFVPEEEILIYGGGFPRLGRLSVCCHVPWLTFSEGAMPFLTYLELKIGGGPRINERIPSGLRNLRCLGDLALHYNAWYINDSNVNNIVNAVRKGVAEHHNTINLIINGIEDEEEYVQEAGDGVAVINRIQEHSENHQQAEEDAARATGSQSKIEIADTPKLYDQSTAPQHSQWYPEDGQ